MIYFLEHLLSQKHHCYCLYYTNILCFQIYGTHQYHNHYEKVWTSFHVQQSEHMSWLAVHITNVTNTLQNVFLKRLNIINTSKSINIFHTRNDFRYSWSKPKLSWVLCEFKRIVSNMADLLFSIGCCLYLLRALRSADISTVFVSASILPDFTSVFTSLLSDLETDLEFTDILFVLVSEQIRSKPSTLSTPVAQRDRLVIAW